MSESKTAKTGTGRKKTPRRVLVTGAAGFVGGHMVEELVGAGYKVTATDLAGADFSVAKSAGAQVIPADLTDPAALEPLFAKKQDYVIHVGALYNYAARREDLIRVNRDGTVSLAESALDAGVEHFIYFSTCDIYGPLSAAADEDTPPKPVNAYAESKWLGEKALWDLSRDRGLKLSVIRPTVVYGPRSTYVASNFLSIPGIVNAVGHIINLHHKQLPVFGGGPRISWVHARDLTGATAFLLGKKKAMGRAFVAADDDPMTVAEMMALVFEAFGYEWQPKLPYPGFLVSGMARIGMRLPDAVYGPLNQFMRRNWSRTCERYGLDPTFQPAFTSDFFSFMLGNRLFDNSRLKALGYKLRYPDSRQGFRETFEWYREQNWLPQTEQVWSGFDSAA